jgi:hypothetical protein
MNEKQKQANRRLGWMVGGLALFFLVMFLIKRIWLA